MNYILVGGELYHHGVKGQKWGRRRYQNPDGSLTPAGKKRYAKAGYAKDFYESNKTVIGKTYDKLTGAHKIAADLKYDSSSKKENDARAEKYAAEKLSFFEAGKAHDAKTAARDEARREKVASAISKFNEAGKAHDAKTAARDEARREKVQKMILKGSKVAGNLMMADLVDDMYYDGAGKRAAKAAVKTMGRAVITANEMRKGGYDIHWYDN